MQFVKYLVITLAVICSLAACSSDKTPPRDSHAAASTQTEAANAADKYAANENQEKMVTEATNKKILFVLTSHAEKGATGEPTGYYLGEVSHPWEVLTEAGYDIEYVSPKGGEPPVDGFNLEDAVNKRFWEDADERKKLANTMRPQDVNADEYAAIHYAGGHGTMWDFAENEELANIAADIYEAGGVVSAVCHGPAGLINVKLSNGSYLVDGKTISAFTNEEEHAVELQDVVPYMLEDMLIKRGAKFDKAGLWEEHVVVDERLVTGQNPASAKKVGEEVLRLLNSDS